MRRPRDRAPKILLMWSERITRQESGKADVLNATEGMSPGDAMASREGTTGVYERGMRTQG